MTAEEHLLQVIETGEPPRKKNLSHLLDWLKHPNFSFRSINRILIFLIVIGLLSVIGNLFFYKPDIQRVYGRVAQANVANRSASMPSQGSVEEYLNTITRRDLFQPGGVSPARPGPSLPGTMVDEVFSNLQLVGISWGAYPEAMLRDKRRGRTYFVKQGDTFEQVLVKEIQKNRVIVEYGGQSKELM